MSFTDIIKNHQLITCLQAKDMNLGMILDHFHLMATNLGMERMQVQHLISNHVDYTDQTIIVHKTFEIAIT